MSQPVPKDKDISPRDLWLEICKQDRASCIVDFPKILDDGTTPQIQMVVLTQEEILKANIETDKFVRKFFADGAGVPGKDETNSAYSIIYENRAASEILYRACKKADNIKLPFFPNANDIGKILTTAQIGMLMKHYVRTQAQLGPIVSLMSVEEYEAWIDKLSTGGSFFIDLLSSEDASSLTMYMVSLLRPQQTDKSSVGMPPEENIIKQ